MKKQNESFEEIEKQRDIKPPSKKQWQAFWRRKGRRGMKILMPEQVRKNRKKVDNFLSKFD